MKKQKDKTYAFRVSSSDLKKIKSQAKRAKMTVTDYLTTCALNKEIKIIDGLDPLLSELNFYFFLRNIFLSLLHPYYQKSLFFHLWVFHCQ